MTQMNTQDQQVQKVVGFFNIGYSDAENAECPDVGAKYSDVEGARYSDAEGVVCSNTY